MSPSAGSPEPMPSRNRPCSRQVINVAPSMRTISRSPAASVQWSRSAPRTKTEPRRSEEHKSELQSLMRISYAVFCLKKNNHTAAYDILLRDTRNTGQARQHEDITAHLTDHNT